MTRSTIRLAGLCLVLTAGAASAQTTGSGTTGSGTTQGVPAAPTLPGAGTVAPETPPGGIARGVIRPSKPVDQDMVTPPPTQGQTMPVIKPPGTAR